MRTGAHLWDTLTAHQRFESDSRPANRGIDMSLRSVLVVFLIAAACGRDVRAQESENSKITTNIGMGVSVPLNPTGHFVNNAVNFVVGVGYNVTKRNSIIGQFMWSGLPPNRNAFLPVRAIEGLGNISGSSNLFTLTGNYRYQRQWKVFGAYVIVGGGMYYRQASLSRRVDVGLATVCQPIWNWWGYSCVSGIVSQDQTLISTGSTVFGGNGGVGFTIKITDDGYKFYVESRYHYAPTRGIATTLIPITLGFAW
jgi:Outer membrane protein beta-barrel domain